MFKLCVKFEQNRTIRCRVTDDLAHYRREIFEGVAFRRNDLRGRGRNFTKLGDDIRLSSMVTQFVSELRYLAALSHAEASKLSDVKNGAIFRNF